MSRVEKIMELQCFGSSNIAISDSQIASWVFFLIASINTASWDKVE